MRRAVCRRLTVVRFCRTALAVSAIAVVSMQAKSDDDAICALSDQQEQDVLAAFHAMAPIFKEPRCINCHGAVDPFKQGGGHVGGLMKWVMEKVVDSNTGETIEQKDGEATMKTCLDCHGLLPKWFLADNPQVSFTNKSEEQLCLQMKDRFGDPGGFVNHMTRDADDFIPEAFKGTRALNENGQAEYLNNTGKDYVLEPPSITHETLIEHARAWANPIGNQNWSHPLDCGCVAHKYKAKITQRWEVKTDFGGLKTQLTSQADFLVDLNFKPDSTFSGSQKVPREYAEHLTGLGQTCEGKGTWAETWEVTGKIDPETHEMTMKVRFDSSPRKAEAVCGPLGGSRTSRGFSSDSVATPLSEFKILAKAGEKRHFEWGSSPAQNTVDLELVKAKR